VARATGRRFARRRPPGTGEAHKQKAPSTNVSRGGYRSMAAALPNGECDCAAFAAGFTRRFHTQSPAASHSLISPIAHCGRDLFADATTPAAWRCLLPQCAGKMQLPAVNALQPTGPKSAAAGRDAHSRREDIRPLRAQLPRASQPRLPAP